MADEADDELFIPKRRYESYETTRRVQQKDATSTRSCQEAYDNFFESPSILYVVVILTGLTAFEVFCFQTHLFPFDMLGGPGRRLKFLANHHMSKMQLGFFVAIVIHIVEAIYCYFQCRSINMSPSITKKWVFQTFLFGFTSLRLLGAHISEVEKNRKLKR